MDAEVKWAMTSVLLVNKYFYEVHSKEKVKVSSHTINEREILGEILPYVGDILSLWGKSWYYFSLSS